MEQRQADGGQSMGLRERKRRATRDAIERAAIALVSERGYDNVTVAQICEASSVSQGTFFNYFRTKDAAIVGIGEYDRCGLCARRIRSPHALLDAARHAHLVPRGGGIVRLGKRHRGAADRARREIRPRSCNCSWTTRSASSAIFAISWRAYFEANPSLRTCSDVLSFGGRVVHRRVRGA